MARTSQTITERILADVRAAGKRGIMYADLATGCNRRTVSEMAAIAGAKGLLHACRWPGVFKSASRVRCFAQKADMLAAFAEARAVIERKKAEIKPKWGAELGTWKRREQPPAAAVIAKASARRQRAQFIGDASNAAAVSPTVIPHHVDRRYVVEAVSEPLFSRLGIGRYLSREEVAP